MMMLDEKKVINLSFPTVPHVAVKVLNLINDPLITLAKLEELIVADQSLTAKILKIANSAFYGLKGQVNVISEAVAVMGFKTLKDVILAASIREIYKVFGLIEKKLWEHGVGVSFAASILTDYSPNIKKDEAYIAGLMHDIGKIILNNNFPSEYANCMNMVHQNKITFIEVEKNTFGYTHCEVGGLLAEKWGFSDELKQVIVNHHDIDYIKKQDDLQIKTLLAVIALADSICTRLGVGYKDPMPDLVFNENDILYLLGIENDMYSKIVDKFVNEFSEYLDTFMD